MSPAYATIIENAKIIWLLQLKRTIFAWPRCTRKPIKIALKQPKLFLSKECSCTRRTRFDRISE